MFRTARWRLVAWNVLVLTSILAVLGVAVYGIFSANVYHEVDGQLDYLQNQEMTAVEHAGWEPYAALATSFLLGAAYRTVVTNEYAQVNGSSDCPQPSIFVPQPQCPTNWNALVSASSVRAALKNGTDTRIASFHGDLLRVRTIAVRLGGTGPLVGFIQTSRSVAPEQDSLHELRRLFIFGALVGIILSGMGSFFLASRALIPIRQAFARQRKFTADASHELRTPLALIRANAEMLGRHADMLPPGDGELIDEIIRETDHLNRLVSDLLTLARADSESAQLSTKPVDFRSLTASVHEDLHLIAESRGIDSHVSLDGPLTVEGDETRLRQLLLILLDNALKYTDPGGRVDVELHREDGRARLVVSDTGIGIPPKDLPHIFDRFYRVDRAREHDSGGTGLGLAIAQWIVQAHHGSIKVESEPGQGTRFQVDLPAM